MTWGAAGCLLAISLLLLSGCTADCGAIRWNVPVTEENQMAADMAFTGTVRRVEASGKCLATVQGQQVMVRRLRVTDRPEKVVRGKREPTVAFEYLAPADPSQAMVPWPREGERCRF